MFSFTLIYWKLAGYKERLVLEQAIRECDAFVQEHRYRYDRNYVIYYDVRTNDYPKFLKAFQEKYSKINEHCEILNVKGA